jgi:hypothetical protein
MKFHGSDPSINWLAHAKPPVIGAEVVDQQLSAAHRYYNRLIEIERERRARYRAERDRLFPELEAAQAEADRLDAELEAKRAEIKKLHANQRSRVTPPDAKREVERLKEERRLASAKAKALRTAAKESPELKAAALVIDEEFAAILKSARAECGAFWPTYMGVEAAVRRASSSSKVEPRFKRWTGDGTISMQLQGGISWEHLVGGADSRVRFVRGGYATAHGAHSPSKRTLDGRVWIRVGSDGRKPVWAVFPCRIWRLPPRDAQIKWVHVDRIKRANRYRWQVRFVLGRETGWAKPCAESGTVGVDLGWRLMPDGLRVAYWVGDDGGEGQLLLPHSILQRKQTSEELRSIRDVNYDTFKLRLASWLDGRELPDWLAEIVQHLPKWRSPSRAERLYHVWREKRFDGDEDGYRLVAEWRNGLPNAASGRRHYEPNAHGDLHLWRYETGTRLRLAKARKDLYRKFARELAAHYAECHVEKIQMAKLVRRPEAEEESPDGATIHYRMIAAVAELVECLKQSGMRVTEIPAKDSTRAHSVCGHVSKWSESERGGLYVTCEGCRDVYDQDQNAARNFLNSRVASGDVAETVS